MPCPVRLTAFEAALKDKAKCLSQQLGGSLRMLALVLTEIRLVIRVAGVLSVVTGRAPGDLLFFVPADKSEYEFWVVFADLGCERGLDGSGVLCVELEKGEHRRVDTAGLALACRVGLLKGTGFEEAAAPHPDGKIVIDLICQSAHHGQRLSKMFRNERVC